MPAEIGEALAECLVRFRVHAAIVVDEHALERVDEFGSEQCGQEQPVEVLTAGGCQVGAAAAFQLFFELVQARVEIRMQAELALDPQEPLADRAERTREVGLHGGHLVAQIQKVRDLGLVGRALTRRRRNDDLAARVG